MQILEWDEETAIKEAKWLKFASEFKYDGYREFLAGARFLERLAYWLQQFVQQDRQAAYDFVREKLVFYSAGEINHLASQFYFKVVKPHVCIALADSQGLPPYLVWQHPDAQVRFSEILRRSLFFGLSDGARTDLIRRSGSGNISNEQVVLYPQISANKWGDLAKDLREATGDPTACFDRIFLIDDFSASGMSIIRNREDGSWKGKLPRFFEECEEQLNDIVSKQCSLHFHHFIATRRAKAHIEKQAEIWRAERDLPIKLEFSWGIEFPNSMVITSDGCPDLWKLTEEYYDLNVMNKSMKVGSEHAKRGFSECALPIILEHNTPNNSVSLLWAETSGGEGIHAMRPLFIRKQRHWED